MSLMEELNQKATALGIPLSAHLDITWRCNERCVHCYLDHDAPGEMTTEEIKDVIRQLAENGTFFLNISGGEPLLRRDCFEILEYARALRFNVKLKTNAVMIGPKQADRLKELGIEQIQISIYSHRAEVHDAITKLPGSLRRSIEAIKRLKAHGLKVSISNVLMRQNYSDAKGVMQLAKDLGVEFNVDPTITPKINGDRSILDLNILGDDLKEVFRTEEFVGNVGEFCAPAPAPDEDILDGTSCSAGHTLIYISPFGDVYPCVQFPMPCGNVRTKSVHDIWYGSSELNELRSVRVRDLPTCSSCSHVSSCSRCPGLAYMEGNMRGPSSADCAKSEARMGFDGKKTPVSTSQRMPVLVQITVRAPEMHARPSC
jgi:AdoMet-dependent heme synthase